MNWGDRVRLRKYIEVGIVLVDQVDGVVSYRRNPDVVSIEVLRAED